MPTWSCALHLDGVMYTDLDLLAVEVSRVCELTGQPWHVLGDPMASPDHLIGYLACFASRTSNDFHAELVRFGQTKWSELFSRHVMFPAETSTESDAPAEIAAPVVQTTKRANTKPRKAK